MIRTLSITATEWASVTDGRLWLVRGGDDCECSSDGGTWAGGGGFVLLPCPVCHDADSAPPAEFVQACAPCETCHEGRLWVQTAPDDMLDTGACPDCRIKLLGPCYQGDPNGLHFLGYAYPVGEPLPIYGDGNPLRREPHLYVSKNGVVWFASEAGSVEATARLAHCGPPESLVGKWALQLEVSE